MKKNVLALLFIFITGFSFGQDLLSTHNGDSLYCKITEIKNDSIYFTSPEANHFTQLPMSKIKTFSMDYSVPKKLTKPASPFSRIRFAINTGLSYDPGKLPSNTTSVMTNYYKKLRYGFFADANFSYFMNQNVGIGIKASTSFASNNVQNITFFDGAGNTTVGVISEKINVLLIGPSLNLRLLGKNGKNGVYMGITPGYMKYENNGLYLVPFSITGHCLGVACDIGYDFAVGKVMAVGAQFSLTLNRLKKAKMNIDTSSMELAGKGMVTLMYLNFSIGIRFFNKKN